jgi:GntR family transcriptional regulator
MGLVSRGATRLIEATDIPEGTVTYLAENADIKQTGYRDTIAARAPDETEIAFFKIPADGRIPVFEIFRVGFDQHGNRFRLTVTVYPIDRNRLAVNVGEVPRR